MKECSLTLYALMNLVCSFSTTKKIYSIFIFGMFCVDILAKGGHFQIIRRSRYLNSLMFNKTQNFKSLYGVGDPDVILNVPGRSEINYLKDWTSSENLQLLNLL